jgi:uncharacterized coiled-coil protein SlyX
MAFEYQGFATLGVNLNRQKYGPLDISNVFTSENDLKYYLTKGAYIEGVSKYWYESADKKVVPYPYEGQVLATVIDGIVKVYVLSLDAEDNFQAKAIEPDVDGKTIVKNANGELAIVAPVDPDAAKTYNFSYANGVYSWVEVDTATAAGQAQAIAGLAERATALEGRADALEATVNGDDGLVDKVADHAEAIASIDDKIAAALEEAKDYADEQDENTVYDDTALTNRVVALETDSADHESRIAEVEKFFKVTGEDKIAEALDTLIELQKEIEADNESAAAMLSSIGANADAIEANAGAIEVLNGEGEGSVAKKIADAIAAENLAQYATVEALNELAGAVEDLEGACATKEDLADVNEALASKIENGSIAHSSEALAEGVTVEGNSLKIVVDAYTKQEVRDYVADVIEDMTGGESAADVLLALNNHIATYEEKVGQLDSKNGEQDTAIQAAKAQADKGVEDAAAVAAALATANSAIEDNTREIGVAKNNISTVNTTLTEKITALENKDATVEGNITALQTTVSGHTTTITEHSTKVAALIEKDAELAVLIQANTDKFANYSDTTAMNQAIDDKIAAIPAVDLKDYAKTADVNAYVNEAIAGVNEEVAKKANASEVYSKTEADAAFMTETQVADKINALINAADPEGGKAIENIAKLVEYVEANAGDIAGLVTDVATNKAAHEANAANIAKHAEDIAALNTAVAGIVIPKESDEISVTEGVIAIKELNVNKLVQIEGDVLILKGGSAID